MPSRGVIRDGVRAALPAAVLSGVPSTLYALWKRRDPLEATAAAGSLLLPTEDRRLLLLMAAAPVHLALSAGWGVALAVVLPRRRVVLEGITAGLLIAAFDLGVVGCRRPRIRQLHVPAQVADHIAFTIIVAMALRRRPVGPPAVRGH